MEEAVGMLLGGLMRVNVQGRRLYKGKQQRQVRQQAREKT